LAFGFGSFVTCVVCSSIAHLFPAKLASYPRKLGLVDFDLLLFGVLALNPWTEKSMDFRRELLSPEVVPDVDLPVLVPLKRKPAGLGDIGQEPLPYPLLASPDDAEEAARLT
jgi:hypothetical protein